MRWLMPAERFFSELGVPKLQHVPIVICEDGNYPFEPNTYLTERCCGEWGPSDVDDPTVLTLRSRQGVASRLCAFLRFCQQDASRDWRCMTYDEHLLGEFQPGLLKGVCSATLKPLHPSTVNAYLDEAVAFLMWAAERGHRGPFKVSVRRAKISFSTGRHSHGHRSKSVSRRHGKIEVVNDALNSLPSTEDVGKWLKAVKQRAPVKALIFELIIRTGVRISEANQLRLTCFPDKTYEGSERWRPRWAKQGWVPVTLRYGVKGGKVEPASMLSLRSRTIEVPIDLADRIWHYKHLIRPHLLRRFTQSNGSKDLSGGRLWLGETKCQPVSNTMLYRVWTESPFCPEGWNPHDGRHFFAVERICEHARLMLRLHGRDDPANTSVGWLHGLLAGHIRLILSPLLGHVNEDTTMLYLRCAHQRLIEEMGHPAIDWNQFLDSDL